MRCRVFFGGDVGEVLEPPNAERLGCFVIARSKSEIRYEGTLFAIDTKDSTVTLQNGASLAGG